MQDLELGDEAKELFNLVMLDIIKEKDGDKAMQSVKIKAEIESFESLIQNVQDDFFARRIDQNVFKDAADRYTNKIGSLKMDLNNLKNDGRSFGRKIQIALGILSNLSTYYVKGLVEAKRAIISSIFPENLFFEQNNYRTNKINEFLVSIILINNQLDDPKNKKPGKIAELSIMAPAAGLEPATL